MNYQQCPKCGAAVVDRLGDMTRFLCSSWSDPTGITDRGRWSQTPECRIAELEAENSQLRKDIAAAALAGEKMK
jgi:ssDNA-binding Zn-finger/Zn-ribbon topoisomerase 1